MEYFNSANTVLFEGDVLKTIISIKDEKVFFLTGNLPYYITSEIITTCLKTIPRLTGAIFMVQRNLQIESAMKYPPFHLCFSFWKIYLSKKKKKNLPYLFLSKARCKLCSYSFYSIECKLHNITN